MNLSQYITGAVATGVGHDAHMTESHHTYSRVAPQCTDAVAIGVDHVAYLNESHHTYLRVAPQYTGAVAIGVGHVDPQGAGHIPCICRRVVGQSL